MTPSGEDSEALHDGMRGYLNDDFLAHHGILGQKWYVRRFQDKEGHLTPEGKLRYAKNLDPSRTKEAKSGFVDPILAAYTATAAVTLTAAAVITTIEHHNKKQGDKLLDKKGIADTSKTFSNENPPRKIEGQHSAEDDMAKINDLYSALRPQTQNNCSHCSIAMELRRRGFDVCARTSSEPVYTEQQVEKIFKPKPKIDNITWQDKPKNYEKMTNEQKKSAFSQAKKEGKIAKNFKDVEKNMLKAYPEGSRGLFSAFSPFTMVGHAMAFEVKGGKVIIYDTQQNRKFSMSSVPAEYTQNFPAWTCSSYRFDNKQIDWSGANMVAAERKKG